MNRQCPVSAPATFPGYLVVPPAPITVEHEGTIQCPATATIDAYAPLVPSVGADLVLDVPCLVLVLFALFCDVSGSASELAFGIAASGATLAPVNMHRAQRLRLWASAPQTVGMTLSMHALVLCNAGTTRLDVMHAGALGSVTDLSLTVVPLRPLEDG